MTLITESGQVAALCDRLRRHPFVTIDTEFHREDTFWSRLCLVQIASPEEAVAIDPLAEGIDLQPLFALMVAPDVVKVFHAARQDLEILLQLGGAVPQPVFDTQVAAMACGYGESISYEKLVARITGQRVDKASRNTDWARRPISDRQLAYALSDVTHLRDIHARLSADLARLGRDGWLAEEMALLTDPDVLIPPIAEAHRRIKSRSTDRRHLAIVKEVAIWREHLARRANQPRARILKDDAIMEVAVQRPRNLEALGKIRLIPKSFLKGPKGAELVACVERALSLPVAELPEPAARVEIPDDLAATVELLKVLLKHCAAAAGVAPRLICTTPDLERLAVLRDPGVPALSGWRRQIFGEAALALKAGRIALATEGTGAVRIVDLPA